MIWTVGSGRLAGSFIRAQPPRSLRKTKNAQEEASGSAGSGASSVLWNKTRRRLSDEIARNS